MKAYGYNLMFLKKSVDSSSNDDGKIKINILVKINYCKGYSVKLNLYFFPNSFKKIINIPYYFLSS